MAGRFPPDLHTRYRHYYLKKILNTDFTLATATPAAAAATAAVTATAAATAAATSPCAQFTALCTPATTELPTATAIISAFATQ